MSAMTLHRRFAQHAGKISDKWSIYLDVYQRLFQQYVGRSINLLEIGIQNGGSLEIWAEHFPHARHIVGCDIDQKCAFLRYDDARVAVVVGDANSDVTEAAITNACECFDIIIDDGSHISGDIIRSFARYFPRVKEGGIFVAEDLHCSYWKEFDGGLFDPYSSIAFFKRLADVVNHEHWGVPGARSEVLRRFFGQHGCVLDECALAEIHSIEFYNSVCVVRKMALPANEIGTRIFAGTADAVSAERNDLPHNGSSPPSQAENRWNDISILPEERAEELPKKIDALTQEIDALTQDIARRQREIDEFPAHLRHEAELENQISAVSGRIMAIESEKAELENQLAAASGHIMAIESEKAELENQLAAASGRIMAIESEKAELENQLAAASGHIMAIESSRSWKITAPLRHIGQLVRAFGRAEQDAIEKNKGEK
jgi:hypothetical protein